jgi:alpha-beta hydrolase superfamily lysophospholipase
MSVRSLGWAVLLLALLAVVPARAAEGPAAMTTADFEFVSGGHLLSGVLDHPVAGETRALVVFVHGYGPTDVRGWHLFEDLRTRFAELGMASLVWDKPGQGRSEGTFDLEQPVAESAEEVLDAVAELRRRGVPGAQRIGLWSISRGGWIAPLAMARDPGIGFWISVSGVDALETFPYMLEQNLRIEGRSEEQAAALAGELVRGFAITSEGGSLAEYLAATEHLRHDPFMLRFTDGSPEVDPAAFAEQQRRFRSGETQVDPATGLMIYVPGFDALLNGLDVQVLALFGEKDMNVDWRRTRALYERTIGMNPDASLTVRTFPDANHNLQRAATGGLREMVEMTERLPAEGYYEAQLAWLRERVLGEP